jgi:hypothetical protein
VRCIFAAHARRCKLEVARPRWNILVPSSVRTISWPFPVTQLLARHLRILPLVPTATPSMPPTLDGLRKRAAAFSHGFCRRRSSSASIQLAEPPPPSSTRFDLPPNFGRYAAACCLDLICLL